MSTEITEVVLTNGLPEEGLVRLNQIIGVRAKDKNGKLIVPPQYTVAPVIPVSKSTWWKGIAEGIYPKPAKKFGLRCTCWDVKDIRKLFARGECGESAGRNWNHSPLKLIENL